MIRTRWFHTNTLRAQSFSIGVTRCNSGCLELAMTLEDAQSASHQGQCDDDVRALSERPDIRAQLSKFDPAAVRKDLDGYGAWNEEELKDHEQNLQRLLWLAAGSINNEEHEKQS